MQQPGRQGEAEFSPAAQPHHDALQHDDAMKQWDKAIRFIERAELSPDTNRVENAIRPFVVGRKKLAILRESARRHTSAGLYSLIEAAKANGHELPKE
jgi:hypothetical protein